MNTEIERIDWSRQATARAPRPAPAVERGSARAASRGSALVLGSSLALREALQLAERVAASRLTSVLLLGETGTGKELFARTIHQSGASAAEPFVAVNCAAIPESLLESELFGHEKGAFTGAHAAKRGLFELAASGTLFLDEIGEMPLALQAKILRALEERTVRPVGGLSEVPVRCRIVAATNRPLEDAVIDGAFREDLYYRLSVFSIPLPPLRERADDVELLARHFLLERAKEQEGAPTRLSDEAVAALRAHAWPGNIRELKNVIERAAILAPGDTILPRHLVFQRRSVSAMGAAPRPEGTNTGVIEIPQSGKSLGAIEREAVELTLLLTRGNVSAAARLLEVARPTLVRRMREYGLARRSLIASS